MSRASDALSAETEKGQLTRYYLAVGAGSYDDPKMYALLQPACACGCGRKARGEVVSIDGRTYLVGHSARVTGDRQ